MKRKLSELAAGISLALSILAIGFLVGAFLGDVIKITVFIMGMAIAIAILAWDRYWINKHFVGGVWSSQQSSQGKEDKQYGRKS